MSGTDQYSLVSWLVSCFLTSKDHSSIQGVKGSEVKWSTTPHHTWLQTPDCDWLGIVRLWLHNPAKRAHGHRRTQRIVGNPGSKRLAQSWTHCQSQTQWQSNMSDDGRDVFMLQWDNESVRERRERVLPVTSPWPLIPGSRLPSRVSWTTMPTCSACRTKMMLRLQTLVQMVMMMPRSHLKNWLTCTIRGCVNLLKLAGGDFHQWPLEGDPRQNQYQTSTNTLLRQQSLKLKLIIYIVVSQSLKHWDRLTNWDWFWCCKIA